MEEPSAASADNIGARARTAAGWQFLSKGINTALQMVTSIVLARLLMPADFGIVAMAAMVTGLAGVFRDLGLGQAIVQRPEISEDHTRSAFWGTLVMALLLYAGMFFAAPAVGAFFDEPRMVIVLQISALSFVLSPFAVVPRSLLQRDLDFKTPFFAGLASSISYGAVGITMALLGYGYWALVFAGLAGGFVSTVALCILTRYLPPLIPTFRGIGDLYGFGVGVTLVGLGYTLSDQLDYIVVGKRLDAVALGLYKQAYSFVTYPTVLASTLTGVAFSAFSRIQDDHTRLRRAYGHIIATISTLILPVLCLAVIAAGELVPTVLGEQWTDSVRPAQALMTIAVFKMNAGAAYGVIRATGRVYGQAWRQFLYAILIGIAAWVAAPYGIVAVSIGVVVANLIHYTLIAHLVWCQIGFGLKDYVRALLGPCILASAASLVAVLCRHLAIAAGYEEPTILAFTILPGLMIAYAVGRRLQLPEMERVRVEIFTLMRRFRNIG
jgi:O-antigen/teichoic acid export membrane protein